jgi:adenylate cyclase
MLRLLTANKAGRVTVNHTDGPPELGRGPQRGIRSPLDPGAPNAVSLTVKRSVGKTWIETERSYAVEDPDLDSLRSVEPPLQGAPTPTIAPLSSLVDVPGAEQLARWLETLVAVQRSAASSAGFYAETARGVVELIGLDCGLVLLRRGDDWEIVARHGAMRVEGAEFSRTILGCVCDDRRTFYQVLPSTTAIQSQVAGSAVVAAPILGADGEVVGVVYGVRIPQPGASARAIRALEAQLVQVLAAAVGAGLARLESEDREARRHRQFMDFFSPELARELDRNPRLLDGERRQVTVLFSDIRGFSRISERLSPEETCALVRDVMECLTHRIREYQGVVVDYIGDAIMALWNAPADQPDHATLACRAALAMQQEMPGLNERWADRIGGPFGLGIGLNTGSALVGNTGSQTRFKYGPLGHCVNLASRVEGATKHLGVPLLITGSTHAALGAHDFATRRLCRIEVVGIAEDVDLYELHAATVDPAWRAWRDLYETGLHRFEAGKLAQAFRILHGLLEGQQGHYDLPTLTLVGRAIEHLKDPTSPFRSVLKLQSK